MAAPPRILVLAGSARAGSLDKKLDVTARLAAP
jgi:hypothetical protein